MNSIKNQTEKSIFQIFTTILSSLVILMSLSLFPNKAVAQIEPCENQDGCVQPWTTATITFPLTSCGATCSSVTVDYAYRRNCIANSQTGTMWQEFQILRIQAGMPNCSGCDLKQIYLEAFYQLVYMNPMRFDPLSGTTGCNMFWRTTPSACLTKWDLTTSSFGDEANPLYYWVLSPCTGVSCCRQLYQICRTYSNRGSSLTITTLTGDTDIQSTCANAVNPANPTAEANCFPMCDWLRNIVQTIYKEGANENRNIFPQITQDITLSPNPTTDKISFKLNAPESGAIHIEIFDARGVRIQEINKNIFAGSNNIEIDSHGLSVGVYYFKIIFGEKLLFNGSLTVMR